MRTKKQAWTEDATEALAGCGITNPQIQNLIRNKLVLSKDPDAFFEAVADALSATVAGLVEGLYETHSPRRLP